MGNVKVLDSWALLAYFEGEPEGLQVIEILKQMAVQKGELFISVVNWGEVLYVIESRYGLDKRDEIEQLINQMQIEVVDMNKDLTRLAAHLKATEKLPYGDSFAAALAVSRKAELVTGDKDFHRIEKKVRIQWL